MKTNQKVDTSLPEIGGLYSRSESEGFFAYVRFPDQPDKLFVKAFPKVKDQHWENWNAFIETSGAEQFNFAEWPPPVLLLVDIQKSLFHGKPIKGVSPNFMRVPGIWMKFVWQETFVWGWFREHQAMYGKPYYDWKRVLVKIDR